MADHWSNSRHNSDAVTRYIDRWRRPFKPTPADASSTQNVGASWGHNKRKGQNSICTWGAMFRPPDVCRRPSILLMCFLPHFYTPVMCQIRPLQIWYSSVHPPLRTDPDTITCEKRTDKICSVVNNSAVDSPIVVKFGRIWCTVDPRRRPRGFWTCRGGVAETKCIPVLLYGLEVCSLNKTQIRSLDYAVLSCYRKLFNVKSNENVRFCMSMFNCDDVLIHSWQNVSRSLLVILHLWTICCVNW